MDGYDFYDWILDDNVMMFEITPYFTMTIEHYYGSWN